MTPRPAAKRNIHPIDRAADAPVYENWPEGSRDLIQSVDAHTDMLAETNRHLATIAECASSTLGFFKKWVPIGMAAAAIIWPSAKNIIDAIAKASGMS